MRMNLIVLVLLLAPTTQAQIPPGYYDNAWGLSGEALQQALHDIIYGHATLSNSDLWAAFYTTDDRSDGFVWDIYSDIPGGTPSYLYTFGTDQCGTYGGEGDCYNREHSFPKSWFNDLSPMDTDLHSIYPTDGWVNQKRGNLPYGEVGAIDWSGTNGSKTGMNTFPGYNGTVFEPIDAYKGDLARTYFYMMTCYMGQIQTWVSDMVQNGDLSPWAENLLLQWHQNDPVSQKEIDRNNAAFAIQQNRNPYIDHPEWVVAIWGPFASILGPAQDPAKVQLIGHDLIVSGPAVHDSEMLVFDALGRCIPLSRTGADRFTLPATMAPGIYQAVLIGSNSVRSFAFAR